jgi:D-threonate/D-erythronate kinase
MIAVIADDFTGAAEIGGVGLRYGLKVLIETVVNKDSDVDLLVIATDTRSLGEAAAYEEVARITRELITLEPKFIFKKIDSVLRGHVAKEMEALMHVANKDKAVIVAANPSVGRMIVHGQYFVDSLPLNETSFADDPDFPVTSAFVKDIVQSSDFPVFSLGLNDELPDSGLIIADVTSDEELIAWTSRLDDQILAAGGSGFFDALLGTIYSPKEVISLADLSFTESSLFIFGSMFPKNAGMLEKFYNNKVVRMNMPEGIYYDSELSSGLLENWSIQVADQLKNGNSVMITIDHLPVNEAGLSLRLRESIGQLVSKVQDKFDLNDLFIEGGATTSVVLKYLKVTKLFPFNEADFGVIQMKADGYPNLCITTKPGSYMWPDHLVFEYTKND